MYKEMVYALEDVLEMKFNCTGNQTRVIIRDILKRKHKIRDPHIYLYETLFFDGIFVVVDHHATMDVQKCMYYTFRAPQKKTCSVDTKSRPEKEGSFVTA
ncbi:MAG: hypothetical protein JW938_05700 [Candidatus Omnitrophica bacterium]|nr:hypothetical protein [Candidatus Omnitrophota bacterium]